MNAVDLGAMAHELRENYRPFLVPEGRADVRGVVSLHTTVYAMCVLALCC